MAFAPGHFWGILVPQITKITYFKITVYFKIVKTTHTFNVLILNKI